MQPSRYTSLGLKDNPFPGVAMVDPTSNDIRVNGSIYNEDIFKEQVLALRQRLNRRENLIYAQNTKFVVGVGKSALILREWRRLQLQSPETTIYVRCGRKVQASTIDGACNAVVDALFRLGTLWKAFCGVLLTYVREADRPVLERGVVDNIVAAHPKPPHVLRARALMIYDVQAIVGHITAWLEESAPRVSHNAVVAFLTTMLSEPGKFQETYLKNTRRQEVAAFISILELLRIGGIGFLYIFLDQFEDLFRGRGNRDIHELAATMRQVLEVSSGLTTFVVTLHPDAARLIRSIDGQNLTTIAPVDDRRVVDLPNIRPEQAVDLVRSYLRHFWIDEVSDRKDVLPFDRKCIESVSERYDGNIRDILQVLHYAVEVAVEHCAEQINEPFLEEHSREITGRVSTKEMELD